MLGVREHAQRFVDDDGGGARSLWPGFRRAQVVHEYARANVEGSERYAQSVPGTSRYRISPLEMTLGNLPVCGDCMATGINSGCIEGAVVSGRLAAHALSGWPRLEDIVGFDHP